MFPLTRILLPIDFSERCLGATRYAEAVAAHFDSEIVLTHVVEPLRYSAVTLEAGVAATGELMMELRDQAAAQLESYDCGGLDKVRVRRVLLEGDPAGSIVQCAREQEVNLIAMPTHGYGPFRRFILGSVTAKVLHDAGCPVLTGVHWKMHRRRSQSLFAASPAP